MSALSALLPITTSAQRLTVKNEVIDCGEVLYEQPVTAQFEIGNSGGTLIVKSVSASCGCTSVEYPKSPVRDGGKFTVSATYDARQLGHFNKSIAVYTNASAKPLYLTMCGVVMEEVVGYTGDFPYMLSGIMADKNDIEFDDVNRGDHPVQKINIKNVGSAAVSPVVMHLPKYLKATVSPTTIEPGRQGVVSIMLDSRRLRRDGLTSTSVYLGAFPGDKVSPEKEITVSAVLLPSFLDITEEELAAAPRITLSQDTLALGRFEGKSKKSGTILIENKGQSELEISSLQMITDALNVSLNKTRLKPGEQARLRVTVNANKFYKARSQPRVLMITNDPLHPKVTIGIAIEP